MSQQCLAAHELSWRHDCAAILASGLTISVNCTLFRNLQAFGSHPNKPLWSMLQCLGACRSVLPQNLARSRTFEAAVPPACFWNCWWFFPPCNENSPIFVSACFKAVSSAGDAAGIPFRRSRSSAMNFNCPAWQDLQSLEPWPWSNRSLRSGQSRVPGMACQ